MSPDIAVVTLMIITLFAATINGALGYGFSSLTILVVPFLRPDPHHTSTGAGQARYWSILKQEGDKL